MNRLGIASAPAALLLGLAALVLVQDVSAQGCRQRATTTNEVVVYDRPPDIKTGRGVVYGRATARLAPGSQVFVCQEATVGFGFSALRWLQIAFTAAGGSSQSWQYGWVEAEGLRIGQSVAPQRQFALIAPAAAQATPYYAPAMRTELAIDAAPPAPPPAEDLPGGEQAAVIALEFQLWMFLLIALVAGILAQTMVDLLDANKSVPLKETGKRLLKPLLFTPIVFLTFMQTAELNVGNNKQLLILSLLAFQAGFFWQKVLQRSSSTAKR